MNIVAQNNSQIPSLVSPYIYAIGLFTGTSIKKAPVALGHFPVAANQKTINRVIRIKSFPLSYDDNGKRIIVGEYSLQTWMYDKDNSGDGHWNINMKSFEPEGNYTPPLAEDFLRIDDPNT